MIDFILEQDNLPVSLSPEEELLVKEAVARQQNVLDIDSAAELVRFKQRIAMRRKRRNVFLSVAATVVILICIGGGMLVFRGSSERNASVIVFEATESVSGSLLYMDGKSFLLNSDEALQALERSGVEVTDSGIRYLADGDPMTNTIRTAVGQNLHVSLSDGTDVHLNSNSMFTYPTVFVGEERKVELVGEAYFSVAKDTSHPFVVNTENIETKVLGTEFNIRNYGGEPSTVTLVNGCIEVKAGKREPIILKPGQTLTYSGVDMNKLDIQSVDVREHTEWRKGFFYFNDKPLDEVFRIIGRYYNVTVECDNWVVLPTNFNLWIDMSKSLEENLKLINEVGGLNAMLRGNRVVIN